MFNSLNDIWDAAYGEEEVQLVGMKVSDELALEFECYGGHLTIEDWDGNWVKIDEHNVIIETGTLGM
jgi:hypothetical protein